MIAKGMILFSCALLLTGCCPEPDKGITTQQQNVKHLKIRTPVNGSTFKVGKEISFYVGVINFSQKELFVDYLNKISYPDEINNFKLDGTPWKNRRFGSGEKRGAIRGIPRYLRLWTNTPEQNANYSSIDYSMYLNYITLSSIPEPCILELSFDREIHYEIMGETKRRTF